MGVKGVVFGVSGDKAAEAELFEGSARLLVLFGGEECGAKSLFQVWAECRADYDGLYRVGAPGFDDAQLFAEGRGLSESYPQDVGVDRCGVGPTIQNSLYGVQVGDPEQKMLSKKLSSALDSASLANRL